ncbi:MAG TPA: hypothetical protein VNL14_14010 [Candidatus Acidoferrales bacterium]|nr:hypothetical protein [Candidatus Acidoferrales bacterium]
MKRIRFSTTLFALCAMLLSGCAAVNRSEGIDIGRIPNRILSALSKPIMEFTEGDAKTTIAWIDQEEKAGRLSADQAREARRCPTTLLAFGELLNRLQKPSEIPGHKGVIFYATVRKYATGGAVEEKVRIAALMTMAACQHLIPTEGAAFIR